MQTTTDELNYFGELLRILHDEELVRLVRRFQMAKNYRMAEILQDELEEREAIWKKPDHLIN
jgi:hypothetical protein